MTVAAGEIRALVGENGSGKSTLVKILAGFHSPDDGAQISVAGVDVTRDQLAAGQDVGMRFVHQDLGLVGSLDSVENYGLHLGYEARRGRPVRWSRQRRRVKEAVERLGYDFDVNLPVSALQPSERTALAVARALSDAYEQPTSLLILDEPTANLPGAEVERLFGLVRHVREDGAAVIFISHHLSEVFDLADTATVLRDGRHIGTYPKEALTEPKLIELMLGRLAPSSPPRRVLTSRKVVLAARGLQGKSLLDLDLEVRAGEILGIAGITGSGREELAGLLFGAQGRRGEVEVQGTSLAAGRPDLSVRAGLALVPADRAANSTLNNHNVRENLLAATVADFMKSGRLSRRLERTATATWLEKMQVRPNAPELEFASLSGGNAQKVIIGRWLRREPKVLILDEPTQGVDVGAKESIHALIEEAADRGAAVIICSTESEELARIATRVLVLFRGEVAREFTGSIVADAVTRASLGDLKIAEGGQK